MKQEGRQYLLEGSLRPQDTKTFHRILNFCLYDSYGKSRGRWDSPQYFDQWVEIGPNDATSRGFLQGL